jgi:hypothetical protein
VLKSTAVGIYDGCIREHPAFGAWLNLVPQSPLPDRIEVLKERRRKPPKSGVYRLNGVGPSSGNVIAKKCCEKYAHIESIIHEELLRKLPLRAPEFYGFTQDCTESFYWVFLEDVGACAYQPGDVSHRRLAASWLADLHRHAASYCGKVALPDRGAAHYWRQLGVARAGILASQGNPAITLEHHAVLQTILRQFDVIASMWERVESLCSEVPRTLVHGDLSSKNAVVQSTGSGLSFLTFDWATTAGWGPPAVDLAQFPHRAVRPDLQSYWFGLRPQWPHVTLRDIQRHAEIGKVFRLTASIAWESESLAYEWLETPMENMNIYLSGLIDAAAAIQTFV